ncbi:hypothetical protein BUE80_DR006566 [Diplocarpon rosae]|nr:hypothetical protein BUE80_DR006566 [Diplocarpon rosae]
MGVLRDSGGTGEISRTTKAPVPSQRWIWSSLTHSRFGDTFCHDASGRYIGLSQNSYAMIRDRSNPNVSSYEMIQTHGNEIVPFIAKLDGDEEDWKIWSFGGIVTENFEVEPDICEGYTYFEVTKPSKPLEYQHQYTGIAKVFYNTATRSCEPKFGGFCAVTDPNPIPDLCRGMSLYVFGHRSDLCKDICVARVNPRYAMRRELYMFWDGVQWAADISSSFAIMPNMQHGQIFPTKMFGSSSPYIWAFVGCTAFGDNKWLFRSPKKENSSTACTLILGEPIAKHIVTFLEEPSGDRVDQSSRADDTKETGDLTVSWSEGGLDGGVLMSKIRFAMECNWSGVSQRSLQEKCPVGKDR